MRSNLTVKCPTQFSMLNSSVGVGQRGGEDQPAVPQGKQTKGSAGLMAKEVLAVDTLKKKLQYEFHFTSNQILMFPFFSFQFNFISSTRRI